MILRVKTYKTCKIGFKTRKPVKSVKSDQTCVKSVQLVKNVKPGLISRFHVKYKRAAAPPPFPLPQFTLSSNRQQIKKSPISTPQFPLSPNLHSSLTSRTSDLNLIVSTLHSLSASGFACYRE